MAIAESRFKSQQEVAAEVGITAGQLSKLVGGTRGKRGEARPLFLLARVLEVRIEWLLFGEEPMRSPDMPLDSFLLAVGPGPQARAGLYEATRRRPGRYRVSTLLRALGTIWEHDVPEPRGGWSRLLDEIETGKIDVPAGGATEAVQAAKRQRDRRRPRVPSASPT